MKKNKNRIVFLCSGGGGNLRFVKQAIDNEWIDNATITAILSDRECGGNIFARLYEIKEQVIDFHDVGQTKLMETLISFQPDIIITTVHRIINPLVVKAFRGKIINLHYSLLPAFGGIIGIKPVEQAMEYGAKFTGVTVHLVDENLDGGKPLVQAAVLIKTMDNPDRLMDVLFRCGCLSLMSAINTCTQSKKKESENDEIGDVCKIKDHYCMFSQKIDMLSHFQSEEVWESIKSSEHPKSSKWVIK